MLCCLVFDGQANIQLTAHGIEQAFAFTSTIIIPDVCMQVLENEQAVRRVSNGVASRTLSLAQDLPAVRLLPGALRRYLQSKGPANIVHEGGQARWGTVAVVKACTVAADVSWAPTEWVMQPIHASTSSHGLPWHDCVEVALGRRGGQLTYGQLQVLFHYITGIGSRRTHEELAFIRLYAPTAAPRDTALPQTGPGRRGKCAGSRQNILELHGAQRLLWAVAPPGIDADIMGDLDVTLHGHYVVVSLSQIVRRVYIMREHSAPAANPAFWLNPFKYFQLPPNYGAVGDGEDP